MMSFAAASYNCVQYSDTENATITVLLILNIVATSQFL